MWVAMYYADASGSGDDEVASVKLGADEPVFRMPFVPEGSYVIKVKDAEDVKREDISNGPVVMPPFHTKETVVRKYGTVEQPLVVTRDMSGVNLAVSTARTAGVGGGR